MRVYRRGALQALSVGAAALATGCSGVFDADRPLYLDDVTVRNGDGVAHAFTLTVERRDSAVAETTVELGRSHPGDGGESRTLETVACEWSGRGPFTVTCTLDGGQTETVRVDDDVTQGAGEHAHVTFTASESGALDWTGYLDDGGGSRRCRRSPSD